MFYILLAYMKSPVAGPFLIYVLNLSPNQVALMKMLLSATFLNPNFGHSNTGYS